MKRIIGILVALLIGAVLYTIAQTIVIAFIFYVKIMPWTTLIGSVVFGIGYIWYVVEEEVEKDETKV